MITQQFLKTRLQSIVAVHILAPCNKPLGDKVDVLYPLNKEFKEPEIFASGANLLPEPDKAFHWPRHSLWHCSVLVTFIIKYNDELSKSMKGRSYMSFHLTVTFWLWDCGRKSFTEKGPLYYNGGDCSLHAAFYMEDGTLCSPALHVLSECRDLSNR